MTPLPELIALRDDLNRQIAERQAAAKAESLLKAHEALSALGLTPADLQPARVSRKAPRAVAVKYRRGADTWTGRGKQPVWLRDALAAGAALAEFKVAA